jgi:uncharacterized protein YodC (DUF2158 family)
MGEFKAGDVVLLKSGSPIMTLRNVFKEKFGEETIDEAYCEWFVCGFPEGRTFAVTSLKHHVTKEVKKT